ncbi:MAG: GNAT family N-acetyltransferase [Pseudomonadota bacterium]
MSVRLETERLVLRQPNASDIDGWTAFFMDDRSQFIRSRVEQSEAMAWRILAGVIGHWTLNGAGVFVFETKDAPGVGLGYAGPWFPKGWPEKEIGWTVWSTESEGKGYVREAAEAARAWVYRDLGWSGAVSYVDARNTRSVRLAERLGATPDWDAPTPRGEQCVVFRHPAPEALQ